ncbi:hypothetical protein DACRYDRAFT_25132 [Dacryopinax primogenitus]|uniref:Uncharacterized protein n=1 Tax=Dacryopinax primogenitus (strain DJM 731) TaxID=1858805 RepID=M5G0N0_DACPD|nr:uncharacterized protein DACRYDRAFT_25132 [Dacryopinax primogenitus]EJT97357.1 hypothetical protein DACRYDRAFT_25132 [Dacryopinax primogenitus]
MGITGGHAIRSQQRFELCQSTIERNEIDTALLAARACSPFVLVFGSGMRITVRFRPFLLILIQHIFVYFYEVPPVLKLAETLT